MMNGAWLAELSHLLGGGMLMLSFMLLLRRQVVAAINSLAAQGVLLALLALCQGAARGGGALPLAALLLLLGQGVLLPLALREWVRRMGLRQQADAAPVGRPLAGLPGGVALVLLAVLALLPVTTGIAAPLREDLVLALAILLIGLQLMAERLRPLGQAIGLASLTNGVLLAALATPVLSEGALPLLPAVAVVAMLVPFGATAAFLTLRPQAGEDPA